MNLLTLALLPILAITALVVGAALVGRLLRRYTVNLLLGVLLLVYFGVTVGLRIFWVAAGSAGLRRPLPVRLPRCDRLSQP